MFKKMMMIIGCICFCAFTYANTVVPCPLTPDQKAQGNWQQYYIFPEPQGDHYSFYLAQIQRLGNPGYYTYYAICMYGDGSQGLMKVSTISPIKPAEPSHWDNKRYPTTCKISDESCQFDFAQYPTSTKKRA